MRNKKNITILVIGMINLIASIFAISKLSKMVPINIFAENVIEKMMASTSLYVLPVLVLLLCVFQVLYRLKTMDKTVTTGKRIEDAVFTLIVGISILVNWILIYIGSKYTETLRVNVELPIVYIITAMLGVVMITIYSGYPINKFGTILGLRTKETLENEKVWRVSNRFNAFTGILASAIVIGISIYFALVGFNWIYLVLALIFDAALILYIPRLFAQMIAKKEANRIVE